MLSVCNNNNNNKIIIAFKGTIRDILPSPHCAANRLPWPGCSGVQVTCCISSSYHVLHIEQLSRAAYRAVITCCISSTYHVLHIEQLSRAAYRALITCNISSTYHVQHTEHLSRATYRALITCNISSTYHAQHCSHVQITCSMSCCVPHGMKGHLSY